MTELTKDEAFFTLNTKLGKISDYSCSDFIDKAENLFPKMEQILNELNGGLSNYWQDQVKDKTEEQSGGQLTEILLNTKSYVDDVIKPLASNSYIENLKEKLQEYAINYLSYKEAAKKAAEARRLEVQEPDEKDYSDPKAYEAAYDYYCSNQTAISNSEAIRDKYAKSANKAHSECETLISNINKLLDYTNNETASDIDSTISVASTNISSTETTIDENGNTHVVTTMTNEDGIISTYEEVTNKDGKVIETIQKEYFKNVPGQVKTKKINNETCTNAVYVYREDGTRASFDADKVNDGVHYYENLHIDYDENDVKRFEKSSLYVSHEVDTFYNLRTEYDKNGEKTDDKFDRREQEGLDIQVETNGHFVYKDGNPDIVEIEKLEYVDGVIEEGYYKEYDGSNTVKIDKITYPDGTVKENVVRTFDNESMKFNETAEKVTNPKETEANNNETKTDEVKESKTSEETEVLNGEETLAGVSSIVDGVMNSTKVDAAKTLKNVVSVDDDFVVSKLDEPVQGKYGGEYTTVYKPTSSTSVPKLEVVSTETIENGKTKETYTYGDSKGTTIYDSNHNILFNEQENYDANNNVTSKTETNITYKGTLKDEEIKTVYDGNGDLDKKIVEKYQYGQDGTPDKKVVEYYDKDNNCYDRETLYWGKRVQDFYNPYKEIDTDYYEKHGEWPSN